MPMLTLSPLLSISTSTIATASATTSVTTNNNIKMAAHKTDSGADTESSSSSAGGIIDMETFHQILDLDEDDTHDFSAGMAWAYFEQAGTTFQDMEEALYVISHTPFLHFGD